MVATSSSIAAALVQLYGERLRACKLASISPLTTRTLQQQGFEVTAEASNATMSGIVAAILASEAKSPDVAAD